MMQQPAWAKRGHRTDGNGRAAAGVGQPGGSRPVASSYVRYIAWDLRLWQWVYTWVITSRDRANHNWPRWLRYKLFWINLYPRARKFVAVYFSGTVPWEEYLVRMAACNRCEYRRERLPKRESGKVKMYCGSCGCPNWWASRLDNKNSWPGHVCPAGKHPRKESWENAYIKAREAELVQLRLPAAGDSERPGSDTDGGEVATVGVEHDG